MLQCGYYRGLYSSSISQISTNQRLCPCSSDWWSQHIFYKPPSSFSARAFRWEHPDSTYHENRRLPRVSTREFRACQLPRFRKMLTRRTVGAVTFRHSTTVSLFSHLHIHRTCHNFIQQLCSSIHMPNNHCSVSGMPRAVPHKHCCMVFSPRANG